MNVSVENLRLQAASAVHGQRQKWKGVEENEQTV